MNGIKLFFSNSAAPELFRFEFSHPLAGGKIVSVRGKSGGASGTSESFQWTPAVKALSILLLRAQDAAVAAHRITDLNGSFPVLSKDILNSIALEGDPGTPASSLDNALGKEPVWLAELFGRDGKGTPLCCRLFRRTNPDRRFPGPVFVALNAAVWSGLAVQIECDGAPVAEAAEVQRLLCLIEGGWKTYDRSKQFKQARPAGSSAAADTISAGQSGLPAPSEYTPLQSILHQCYLKEITESLTGTDIFNRRAVHKIAASVAENESFVRVAGKSLSIVSPVDMELSAAGRVGICSHGEQRLREFSAERGLSIACGVALFGALSIFEYLRFRKGHRIEIDFEFPHAVEIVRHLLAGRFSDLPDLLVLGVPPAASLLARPLGQEYLPLMLMPSVTQKIVAPGSAGNPGRSGAADSGSGERYKHLNSGRFLLMGDDPSHPSFMFESLKRRGFVRPDMISTESLEPDETIAELRQGDPDTRAILFFPYYDLNRIFNGCTYLPNPVTGSGVVMVMMHRRIAEDETLVRALDVALRDAWLSLRESAAERDVTVRQFINNRKFVRAVSRFGGLHNLGDGIHIPNGEPVAI